MAEETIGEAVRGKQRPSIQERSAAAWAWLQSRAVWIIIGLGIPYVLWCWIFTVLIASIVRGGPSCGGG